MKQNKILFKFALYLDIRRS